jgi:hypothetical protein
MSPVVTRPNLDLVRELLAARSERCPSCDRHVQPVSPNLRLRGAWFHASCAGYRSRLRAAS